MPIQNYRSLILVVTVVLALIVASPAIQQVALTSSTTPLTELSIFGSYHNATYPFNVTVGQSYTLYLNVHNRLGSSTYYMVEVKFRNETQSAPDGFSQTNSALPSLGNISFCVANNQELELPITVSFVYNLDSNNPNQLDMQTMAVDGFPLSLSQTTISWDPQDAGFYGNLFFELWVFNNTANAFQYNQRYVNLWLNLTV